MERRKKDFAGKWPNLHGTVSRLKLLLAPRVFITQLAFQKIKCFVDSLDHEVNGFGCVDQVGTDFLIRDVFLIDQEARGSVEVETDGAAFNTYIYELIKNGGDPGTIKFQWHSHVRMPAWFSGTDLEAISHHMNDYMISLVINQFGEYECRLDQFQPYRLALNVQLLVAMPRMDEAMIQGCKEEIQKHVRVGVLDRLFGRESPEPIISRLSGIDVSDVNFQGIAEIGIMEDEDGLHKTDGDS